MLLAQRRDGVVAQHYNCRTQTRSWGGVGAGRGSPRGEPVMRNRWAVGVCDGKDNLDGTGVRGFKS
jgi:hypothetical protein